MSYSRIADHSNMVFDEVRNEAYASALRQSVHAGSVVLDLGAGLGIHGLLAAAAGAARVYLVDPQPVVQIAVAAARSSGFGDRVIVVQERIEDTELPEQVDAIVSVLTGNLLFSEDLLPSLFEARDRYLKPGGTMVPDRAQLVLAPLTAPELHRRTVSRWSERVMGLDYSGVRLLAVNELLGLRREELQGSSLLGAGAEIVDLDLMHAKSADCTGKATCQVQASGVCHGLLGSIRIRLGGHWLSTALDAPEVHWSPIYLPIDPPLSLEAGEEVEVTLLRPSFGDWTWTLRTVTETRRHSTFLANADGPRHWANAAPHATPSLSARGRRVHAILDGFAQGRSNSAIAVSLAKSESISDGEALRQVQAIALRYGGRN